MSILIDRLVSESVAGPKAEYDGIWYVAKPLGCRSFWFRLKEAWNVLFGKRLKTFHYKKDEE